ncbi:MAG TPA: PEP-CTERM sorting domain-containing protein [Verrucomicrobiae bacterium]|nr:PEP-CTERM sorting domain-containing protein [Verrucomicrobiae bacterium]
MKRVIIASLVAMGIFTAEAQALTNIVFYSFNTNGFVGVDQSTAMTNYLQVANIGSGISSFSFSNSQATPLLTILSSVTASPNNHGFPAGNSVGMNGWNGGASYFQFTLNATGFQGLVLAWAGNRSSTGPTNVVLQYSSDGGATFNNFNTFAAPANVGTTQDVSAVTALDNNALDVFRIVGVDAAAAGTLKIDNFSIEATAVPEPSTMLLVGVGVLGMFAIRRRRS